MSFLPDFMLSNYIYLIIWFIVLIKGADVLVSWASNLASKFWISPLVIGLTIVAFGTSAPELFVNVFSALKWETDLALWNIVGSNIANTWLVLGAAALVYPLQAKSSTIYKEVPFSLIASLALFFLAFDTFFSWANENIIYRGESLVFLLLFIIFFSYTFWIAKTGQDEVEKIDVNTRQSTLTSLSLILLWLIWLALWADLLINSAVDIAVSFNVPESIIGLTIIAFGTSAPELVTSVVASFKKQADIAIGSIVWSNIFNILLVLWITWTISNVPVTESLIIDICIALFSIVLLILFLFFIWKKGLITRPEGAIFLTLYFIYLGYLIQTQIL